MASIAFIRWLPRLWQGKGFTGTAAQALLTGVAFQVLVMVSGVAVARLLGPEGRGYLALLLVFAVALWQAGSLGLPQALTYFSAGTERSPFEAFRLLRVAVGVQLVVVLGLHVLVLSTYLAAQSTVVRFAAVLTLVLTPVALTSSYGLAALQALRQFNHFNALRILPTATYSLALILLLLTGRNDLAVVVGVYALSQAVGLAATGVVLSRRRSTSAQRLPAHDSIASYFRFGARALVGSVAPIQSFRVDQAVVGLLLSPRELGIYVVGQAFTNLPLILAYNLGLVAFPYVASHRDHRESAKYAVRFALLMAAVGATVLVPLIVVADSLVQLFFGSEFAEAVSVLRILLVASLFMSVRRVLCDGLRGLGQTAEGTLSELVSLPVLVAALVIMAPRGRVDGVAMAVAASAFVGLVLALTLQLGRSFSRVGRGNGNESRTVARDRP